MRGIATCTHLIGYAFFSPPITELQIGSLQQDLCFEKKGELYVGHVKGAAILKRETFLFDLTELNPKLEHQFKNSTKFGCKNCRHLKDRQNRAIFIFIWTLQCIHVNIIIYLKFLNISRFLVLFILV